MENDSGGSILPKRATFFALTASILLGLTLNDTVDAATKSVIHPQAVVQPDDRAQKIRTLFNHEGRLYAGYGDYAVDSGPTALNYFDGSKFAGEPAFMADTEQVGIFRTINGKVYVPSVEPRSGGDFAVGTPGANGDLQWQSRDVVGATHVYDVATITGTDLYLIGSMGSDAAVWKSTDGGASFAVILTVPAAAAGDIARFYGGLTQNGKLYVQAADYRAERKMHPASKVYDGSTWVDGPDLGLFTNSRNFLGKSILQRSYHAATSPAVMSVFDGTAVTNLSSGYFFDYTISDNGVLYGLNSSHKIVATTDLETWVTVGTAPADARSIGVLKGVVYAGGSGAKVYQIDTASVTGAQRPSK